MFPAVANRNLPIVIRVVPEKCQQHSAALSTELRSYDDNSPLHLAVRNQNPEIIKLLLKHKAEVNVKNVCGSTLIYALFEQIDIVEFLIGKGADVI